MNLSELPSRLSLPVGVDAGAVQASSDRSVSAQLRAASGNQLLELDVWGGASAAERVLNTRSAPNAPAATQLDQLVHHILAPLG